MTLEIKKYTIDMLAQHENLPQLLKEYANESSIQEMPKFNPNIKMYRTLEKSGLFHTFVAVADGKIVGFILVLVTILPHYSVLAGVVESFFVAKKYRKTGVGIKLRQTAETHAKNTGACALLISAPMGGVLEKILPYVGYRETNRVFFKSLGNV